MLKYHLEKCTENETQSTETKAFGTRGLDNGISVTTAASSKVDVLDSTQSGIAQRNRSKTCSCSLCYRDPTTHKRSHWSMTTKRCASSPPAVVLSLLFTKMQVFRLKSQSLWWRNRLWNMSQMENPSQLSLLVSHL